MTVHRPRSSETEAWLALRNRHGGELGRTLARDLVRRIHTRYLDGAISDAEELLAMMREEKEVRERIGA